MPRTKGALNKVKQMKVDAKQKVEKEIKAIEPKEEIISPAIHHPLRFECKECIHQKDMHYGGHKGHCNTPNCPCLEFK